MPRNIILLLTVILLFASSRYSLAVELTLHNLEVCDVKVALTYLRGDARIVEGWYLLEPDEKRTVNLHSIDSNSVYAHAVFAYPQIIQYIPEKTAILEKDILQTHFRYSDTLSVRHNARKAIFYHILPLQIKHTCKVKDTRTIKLLIRLHSKPD